MSFWEPRPIRRSRPRKIAAELVPALLVLLLVAGCSSEDRKETRGSAGGNPERAAADVDAAREAASRPVPAAGQSRD